jgi:hypothetical protein
MNEGCRHDSQIVGAGLLAMAVDQSIEMLNLMISSLAAAIRLISGK